MVATLITRFALISRIFLYREIRELLTCGENFRCVIRYAPRSALKNKERNTSKG